MRIYRLQKPKGSTTSRKRVGRGPGSGIGGTSGKGHKGSKARAGASKPARFEGGQMPLVRRVPKSGFHNISRIDYQVVNVGDLARKFTSPVEVTPGELKARKLIKSLVKPVKILGVGELSVGLILKVHAASKSAIEKINAAGGKLELLK